MNSYQIYQQGSIPNNRIRQNDMRLNYVYNRANQNIDHIRDNFNNNQREAPIRITKNVYRNESNEISSVLNNDPYHFKNRFSESNSSNNYNSTNYSSFQNNNNENNFPNNNEISRHSLYSNFYRNNYNYEDINNNYQKMPIYSHNANINSMNNMNRLDRNRIRNNILNSNEQINFNGINMNIGSRINNVNPHNNYNNFSQNNSYENNFRRSTYSNRSENINIGNNNYNINLSSITSQDIYKSFEKQKKENERKIKEEYSNYLLQQIKEKNKRKELEKQKRLKEDLEYEQKYQNDYNKFQQKDPNEKNNNNNNEKKINDIDNIKVGERTINEKKVGNEDNYLDKNILETLRKNQYPLINDIQQTENNTYRNKNNNYKIENIEQNKEKFSSNRSMIKSGLNIIEGNKSKENFYQRENTNENDLNNSNKKINSNKETELYLDKIIQKTDLLSQALNKGHIEDDQRMKDILKVLDNNKNDKFNRLNNVESKNNFTPDKNRILKNNDREQIQDINLGAINFHSKYENYENINTNRKNMNKKNSRSKYTSNIKNNEEPQISDSMKGISEFITSTSRKKIENIKGTNLFNNQINNSKNTAFFGSERQKDKKYILKDDILKNRISANKKPDFIEVKDSLVSNMKITFGEGGNLKFSIADDKNDNYNNKASESSSTLNDTKNQEKSVKHYTFGENFEKETNNKIKKSKTINAKEEKEEEIDEDDEEKYDIKVNSENDIDYDNMLKSTKQNDLKFLDFDQFCDIENDNNENDKNKRKKKKKKSNKHQKNNANDINEDDELCNITISDKGNENKENNNKSEKDNDNINKMTESKKVQMQLNFFSDSITKGISHKRNDKSIFKNNNENGDENMNLLSKDILEQIKNNQSQDDKMEELNRNILDESKDLRDSFGDNILKNIDKYRGEFQKE